MIMKRLFAVVCVLAMTVTVVAAVPAAGKPNPGLWGLYRDGLRGARYINLSHRLTPQIPVWKGFGPSFFAPALNPETGQPYTYAQDGFEATSYQLSTDQFGTQLDPPAHWAPEYAAIDEIPPTFAVRPLVVISIVKRVRENFNYSMKVSDIRRFEKRHGRVPRGGVVFVRSDWSKRWPDPALAGLTEFPGVSLDALKFLHHRRRILFHGHEPLDTDSTPTLEGEDWLMHHGYAQAEGVANLSGVPATGCLLEIGFPRFGGGVGGYARFVAICPPDTKRGVRIGGVPEAPLRRYGSPLHWDPDLGMRVR
jgi:kynurenine formamidase